VIFGLSETGEACLEDSVWTTRLVGLIGIELASEIGRETVAADVAAARCCQGIPLNEVVALEKVS
jgi:hypothetical protein